MKLTLPVLNFFLGLSGAIWSVFAIFEIFGGKNYLLALLMFINAIILFWITWKMQRPEKKTCLIAAGYILINLILTLTDQFGLLDLLVLMINIAILGLLLFNLFLLSVESKK